MKTRSVFVAMALAFGVALVSSKAQADGLGGDNVETGRISIGGRGSYYMPLDSDDKWYGGAQLRFHLTQVWAVEGAADYRRAKLSNGQRFDVFPVQASLIGYLLPGKRVSPFVLAGAGWYFTHLKDAPSNVDDTQNRFGPHVGGGIQVFLNSAWSIDSTYKYIWVEDVASRNETNVANKDYRDRGHQVTIGLNYHFPVR